jgi:hypothetical protein
MARARATTRLPLQTATRTEYAEAIKSLGVGWEKLGTMHWVVRASSLPIQGRLNGSRISPRQ